MPLDGKYLQSLFHKICKRYTRRTLVLVHLSRATYSRLIDRAVSLAYFEHLLSLTTKKARYVNCLKLLFTLWALPLTFIRMIYAIIITQSHG